MGLVHLDQHPTHCLIYAQAAARIAKLNEEGRLFAGRAARGDSFRRALRGNQVSGTHAVDAMIT